MTLFNSVIQRVSGGSRRVKVIRNFALQAGELQHQQLQKLLRQAARTQIGQEYGFADIRHYDTFRNRIPVRDYEAFSPYVERMCRGEANVCWPGVVQWFAKSSGTTNAKSKFIPVSREALLDCHYRGAKDVVYIYFDNYPQSHLFPGKCLTLGGSRELSKYNSHSYIGDLSAILIGNAPRASQLIKTPKPSIALLPKWEEKLEKITQATMNQNVTSLAGVPSWFMILLRHMMAQKGAATLHDIWPNLELFMHGGVNFTPYRQQYDAISARPLHYLETYNASEGFFAFQTSPDSNGLELMLDYGIFFEFVPLAEVGKPFPISYSIDEVELGKDYALVISTNGGLWRYMIGDTVRFVELCPYKIIISGRTKHYINAFGEELMIDNAERALQQACQETCAVIKEYTAAPVFMAGHEQGCHEWLIEFEQMPNSLEAFTHHLDVALQQLNSDYEAKRYKNITLAAPRISVAQQGLFYDWLSSKGKLGGQNKVPRLANNREIIDSLLSLMKK